MNTEAATSVRLTAGQHKPKPRRKHGPPGAVMGGIFGKIHQLLVNSSSDEVMIRTPQVSIDGFY